MPAESHFIAANLGPVFVVLLIVVVIAVVAVGLCLEKKRRDALAALAARLGLRFYRGKNSGVHERYSATKVCSKGHSRKASNVITGPFGDGEVCYFDYRYTVGSGKNQTTYRLSLCAFHCSYHLASMIVRPESFLDKAAALVGFDDIDLDLAEFNDNFFVRSSDKKFAYDVLSQRAMEFLLGRRKINLETAGNYGLFYYNSKFSVPEVERLIRDTAAFFDLMPDYVKSDRRLGGNASGRATVEGVSPQTRGRRR